MKIFYNGQKLNEEQLLQLKSENGLEINSNEELNIHHLMVIILFNENENSQMNKNGIEIFHNISEIHLNYNGKNDVAIESNYHNTGMTYRAEQIETIIILEDCKFYAEF